jgi:hypothetical protein
MKAKERYSPAVCLVSIMSACVVSWGILIAIVTYIVKGVP